MAKNLLRLVGIKTTSNNVKAVKTVAPQVKAAVQGLVKKVVKNNNKR